MFDLAKKTLEYRARHHLSQAELAAKCGLHRQTIVNAEAGRHVAAVTEVQIRMVLDEDEEEEE